MPLFCRLFVIGQFRVSMARALGHFISKVPAVKADAKQANKPNRRLPASVVGKRDIVSAFENKIRLAPAKLFAWFVPMEGRHHFQWALIVLCASLSVSDLLEVGECFFRTCLSFSYVTLAKLGPTGRRALGRRQRAHQQPGVHS